LNNSNDIIVIKTTAAIKEAIFLPFHVQKDEKYLQVFWINNQNIWGELQKQYQKLYEMQQQNQITRYKISI